MMNIFPLSIRTAATGLLVATLIGTCGCRIFGDSPSGSLASVSISHRPMADVHSAVTMVFLSEGFTAGASGENEFTFTRPGGKREQTAYGNDLFDRPLKVKVVVTTQQKNAATVVVVCNAWVIEAEHDPVFKETHPVRWLGRRPYVDLLAAVKTRLGQ
jgi:hypothetical protein